MWSETSSAVAEMPDRPDSPPHVVIIGGGFGGLAVARSLRRASVRITILDRTNHHLFQPLLYQVAMAGLSPADIAAPIRSIVRRQRNTTVYLADVTGIDLDRRVVALAPSNLRFREIPYDWLVVAAGARTFYFGREEWSQFALGLKTVEDALAIRHRVLTAFEAAERERDSDRRRERMTFVVVGGGPTGVELAGALAEISRFVLARDFREIRPGSARIVLLEGEERILGSFDATLSAGARKTLERMGVEVRTGEKVTAIDERGVELGEERIDAGTVLWAAGVRASELTDGHELPRDRGGRWIVEPALSLPGYPEVFAIGDIARFDDEEGRPLPGVAPVAMQQGRHVGRIIASEGRERVPFRYVDRGNMATIGRSAAIAEIGEHKLTGFIAWLAWLCIHLVFLIGFRNRLAVLLDWTWSYLTYGRGARLIIAREGGAASASEPESES